jgi:hypothetical protein
VALPTLSLAQLVQSTIEHMDLAFQQALKYLVEFLDMDRGSLVEFPDDQTHTPVIFSFARPDIPQAPAPHGRGGTRKSASGKSSRWSG